MRSSLRWHLRFLISVHAWSLPSSFPWHLVQRPHILGRSSHTDSMNAYLLLKSVPETSSPVIPQGLSSDAVDLLVAVTCPGHHLLGPSPVQNSAGSMHGSPTTACHLLVNDQNRMVPSPPHTRSHRELLPAESECHGTSRSHHRPSFDSPRHPIISLAGTTWNPAIPSYKFCRTGPIGIFL